MRTEQVALRTIDSATLPSSMRRNPAAMRADHEELGFLVGRDFQDDIARVAAHHHAVDVCEFRAMADEQVLHHLLGIRLEPGDHLLGVDRDLARRRDGNHPAVDEMDVRIDAARDIDRVLNRFLRLFAEIGADDDVRGEGHAAPPLQVTCLHRSKGTSRVKRRFCASGEVSRSPCVTPARARRRRRP
jgi:hypothetical protein